MLTLDDDHSQWLTVQQYLLGLTAINKGMHKHMENKSKGQGT